MSSSEQQFVHAAQEERQAIRRLTAALIATEPRWYKRAWHKLRFALTRWD